MILWDIRKKEREETFSRALTSTTVLLSRAMRLSLMALATSCGDLGLDGLKNENDMVDSDRLILLLSASARIFVYVWCLLFRNELIQLEHAADRLIMQD